MRRRLTLVMVVAVLMIAALPATVLAATKTFSASASIERSDPGAASLDLTTGLLTTTGQVFKGRIDDTDWRPLNRAGLTVYQNSSIGADIFDLVTNSTGTTPLAGVAWGTFEIERSRRNGMVGEFQADILGTLSIDPTCAPTDIFASAGIPSIPVRVQVSDQGMWAVVDGSAGGFFKRIDEAGGSLAALANGCLGAEETAQITITGELGNSGRGNGQLKERLEKLEERIEQIRDERGDWRERVGELQERVEEWRERFGGDGDDDRGNGGGERLRDRLSGLFERLRDR